MRITISGPPGSGKTTVAKLLAKKLNYPLVSGGEIFRRMAREMNMDLVEFSKYAEQNPEIDRKIDEEIVRIVKSMDDVVVDSRLGGWMMHLHGIDAFKVYIDASPDVRARRIMERDGGNFEKVLNDMLIREESEKKRYLDIYGIDFSRKDIYDLVINSDDLSPEEIITKILDVIG